MSDDTWDRNQPGQYIIPHLSHHFPQAKILGNEHIIEPDMSPTPDWFLEYIKEISMPPKWIIDFVSHPGLEMNRIAAIVPHTQMFGENIYFYLSKDSEIQHFDLDFLMRLEEIITHGGNLVIYLDDSDNLTVPVEDMGYHHALVGLEPTPELIDQFLEDESEVLKIRTIFGYHAIPLPVLLTLLGYVTYTGEQNPNWEKLKRDTQFTTETLEHEITLPFAKALEVLCKISKGNIKLGSRLIRDRQFHPHRKVEEPTVESLDLMYSGPTIPTSLDDEEGISRLKNFLIDLFGEAPLSDTNINIGYAYDSVMRLINYRSSE